MIRVIIKLSVMVQVSLQHKSLTHYVKTFLKVQMPSCVTFFSHDFLFFLVIIVIIVMKICMIFYLKLPLFFFVTSLRTCLALSLFKCLICLRGEK